MARSFMYSTEEKRVMRKFGFKRMKDIHRITWGDAVDKGKMTTPEEIRKDMRFLAETEQDKIIVWRTLFRDHKAKWFNIADQSIYKTTIPQHRLMMAYFNNIERMFASQGDLNKVAIDAIHEGGMEAWHWGDGLFDNFAPPSVLYQGMTPFAWEAKLQTQNPGICRMDRFGRPQYGVWEYRYPEAREFTIQRLVEEVNAYSFDGMMLSTRTHSVPALDGEQYGYNDVVDDELKLRTGLSFNDPQYWRNPNAHETRRRILGESVTLFLRDLRKAWPKGKKLVIGIPRTDYWGPPYGNVFIDWRVWVEEKLVDGLYLDDLSGKALYYPAIVDDQYHDYLADEEAGIGLRPYIYDLEHVFGPACAEAGAELLVYRDAKSVVQAVYGGEYRPRLERGEAEQIE
ncbi:MAG: hypothetical protein WCS96_10790 [Victivallales bacterium]